MDTLGWRGVFASLFVVGALIIIAGFIFMKNITEKEEAEINILYVALSSLGFASFLIGVNNISGGLLSLKSGGLILLDVILLFVFSVFCFSVKGSETYAESSHIQILIFQNCRDA